ERRGNQGIKEPQQIWDGIICPRGVGGMALAAFRYYRGVERAAPADLDGIAQHFRARGFANKAMIKTLALIIGPTQELLCAIDGGAFLVSCDEKADRTFGHSAR